MIADHLDFFEGQTRAKVYLHTLFTSIWDLCYKAGRLYEESIDLPLSRYYSTGVHHPTQNEAYDFLSFFTVSMKDVNTLLPSQAILEYMKMSDKYLNTRLTPLQADIASF